MKEKLWEEIAEGRKKHQQVKQGFYGKKSAKGMEELQELALQRMLKASLQGNTINRLQRSESLRAGRP